MAHVFVSYCHEDADFAQILAGKLRDAAFPVRMDLNLSAGENWRTEIDGDLKGAFAVVLVMSTAARASPYVNYEWAFAIGAGVPVLPLLLKLPSDGLHPRLGVLQCLDFGNYQSRPWEKLFESLRDLAERQGEFTLTPPRDAPPVVRAAARALDSMNPDERQAAIQSLEQTNHPAALQLLVDALRHPSEDVRFGAASTLGETHHDVRALPALLEALRRGSSNLKPIIRIGEPAVPGLLEALQDKNFPRRADVFDILGHIGGAAAVRALILCLNHPEAKDRRSALWYLGGTKDPSALPALREVSHDTDTGVRAEAPRALAACGGPAAVADLLELLRDSDRDVRHAAAAGLRDLCMVKPVPEGLEPHIPRLVDALIEALRDEYHQVRYYASMALNELGDARAVPGLVAALRDKTADLDCVARALEPLSEAALPELLEALQDPNETVRIKAIDLIVKHPREPDALLLAGLLADGSAAVREDVVWALGRYPEAPGILQVIIERLEDTDEEVRLAAIRTLAEIGNPAVVPHLINCLEVEALADAAAGALDRMDTRESRAALRAWKRRQIE